MLALTANSPDDGDRLLTLPCCLLPPTSNFGFLHLAVVQERSVYSCNGSCAGARGQQSKDCCAPQTGTSRPDDWYVQFSGQPLRAAVRCLTATPAVALGFKQTLLDRQDNARASGQQHPSMSKEPDLRAHGA